MDTRVIFVRHGEAEGARFPGNDADRPLTTLGEGQAEAVAKRLKAQYQKVDRLWASPLRRAQETAAILQEAGLAASVEPCSELAPERPVAAVTGFVESLGEGTFLLVGHEPLLSATVETLCFGKARGTLALGKGSCCVVERGEGSWRLVALMPAQWLP